MRGGREGGKDGRNEERESKLGQVDYIASFLF